MDMILVQSVSVSKSVPTLPDSTIERACPLSL